MLDPKKCFAILGHVVTAMRSEEEFNLLEWDIHYELAQLTDSDTRAECTRNTDYRQAWIKFDPSHCDTYEQAYEACVHEVFHIVAASLDVLWAGRSRTNEEDGRWHAGVEPLITKLERFYARKFRKFEDYFTDEGGFKVRKSLQERLEQDTGLPSNFSVTDLDEFEEKGFRATICRETPDSTGKHSRSYLHLTGESADGLVQRLKERILNNAWFNSASEQP